MPLILIPAPKAPESANPALRWVLMAAMACVTLPQPAVAQDCGCELSATCVPGMIGPQGCWSGPYVWDCIMDVTPQSLNPEISHAALIPQGPFRGQVLLWHHDGLDRTTVTTKVWILDPDAPETLVKVEETLDSNIFCAGMSWDALGNLLVAGGGGPDDPFTETYRFLPDALVQPAHLESGDPCEPGHALGDPWVFVSRMSIERFYPTVITLLRGDIDTNQLAPGDVISGGSALVLGGDVEGHQVGNDFFQLLPAEGPGAQSWSHTLRAESGGLPLPSGLPFEGYAREPDAAEPEPRMDYYPRAFQLASTGTAPELVKNVFVANDVQAGNGLDSDPISNAPGTSWVLKPRYDASQLQWEMWAGPNAGPAGDPRERYYGGACLMHEREASAFATGRNRVLLFGGRYGRALGTFGIWDEVQELHIAAGQDPKDGQWVTKSHRMRIPRYYINPVILPTGEVLLVGGACEVSALNGRPRTPASCPELYDPGDAGLPSGAFSTVLASNPDAPGESVPFPRLYHNVAVLLPDGRVLLAGGHELPGWPEGDHSGEIFSPPYMGCDPRPTILSVAPDVVSFGKAFDVILESDPGKPIDAFVLLRPAAVTHHFDNDQRYVELEFEHAIVDESQGIETYRVSAPADDLAPPGYYMLFAVRRAPLGAPHDRVPSVAHFIRLF